MKKYIKPIVKIVEVENDAFLAGSTPGIGDPYTEGSHTGKSKRYNNSDDVWDFEEFEEE